MIAVYSEMRGGFAKATLIGLTPIYRSHIYMKRLVLGYMIILTGCAGYPSLQFEPSSNSKVFALCERFEKTSDRAEHYHCNKKQIFGIGFKF